MAGGGAVYLNFDTDDGEISPNTSMIIEKHDEVQCSIPHGRWRCLYKVGEVNFSPKSVPKVAPWMKDLWYTIDEQLTIICFSMLTEGMGDI